MEEMGFEPIYLTDKVDEPENTTDPRELNEHGFSVQLLIIF
jgi:hypothetical protein